MIKVIKGIILILIVVIFLSTVVVKSFAEDKIILNRIKGEVYYKKSSWFIFSSGWIRLKDSTNIKPGDLIKTSNGAKAEVTFANQAKVLIKSDSKLKLLKNKDKNINLKRVKLTIGEIIVKFIHEASGSTEFEVETPSAVAGVRGTLFSVKVNKEQEVQVLVDEGKVEVNNSAGRVLVRRGNMAKVSSLNNKVRLSKFTNKDKKEWNKEKKWIKETKEWSKEVKEKKKENARKNKNNQGNGKNIGKDNKDNSNKDNTKNNRNQDKNNNGNNDNKSRNNGNSGKSHTGSSNNGKSKGK